MTPEERQMLSDLFERIRSTSGASRDSQAEAFINDAIRAQPYAPYVLSQTVIVQQHALEAAQKRIQELEEQARSSSAQPQQETSFLGRLFGAGPSAPLTPAPRAANPYDASSYQRGASSSPGYAPQQDSAQQQGYAQQPRNAPQPQGYAPQQQSYAPQTGPWGAPSGGGGGFLGGALQTATGVAGGMLAANALEGLLGGHRGGGLFGGGGGLFGGGGGTEFVDTSPREVVNNYYGSDLRRPSRAGQLA